MHVADDAPSRWPGPDRLLGQRHWTDVRHLRLSS